MKWFILIMLTTHCYAQTSWHNQKLPMAEGEKPLYQWAGWPPPGNMWLGGKCSKVRIPSKAELKEQLDFDYAKRIQDIRIKEVERGSWWFRIGLIAAAIGFMSHFVTAYPLLQKIGEWALLGGLGCASAGLLIKKASEYQGWLTIGLIGLISLAILYKCRSWSISHVFKKEK